MIMICLDGVEMPKNCHDCDALGISDVVGLKCPCKNNQEIYDYENRPSSCLLYEISLPGEFIRRSNNGK